MPIDVVYMYAYECKGNFVCAMGIGTGSVW